MAERRMFAKTIIDSDAFLDMPLSAQSLYFHLAMRADDDGFINNPKKIQRMIGASEDDCKLLIAKKFVLVFDTGIIVIRHWKLHNYIQKDRYKETVFLQEKQLIEAQDNGVYEMKAIPSSEEQTNKTARQLAYEKSSLPYSFSYKIRTVFLGKKCPVCGCTMSYENNLVQPTIQHNVPISKGGEHELGNISVVCASCNKSLRDTETGKLNADEVVKEWDKLTCTRNGYASDTQDRLEIGEDRLELGEESIEISPTACEDYMYADAYPQADQPKKVRPKINYQEIADMYNTICISLPRMTTLSDKRKEAIAARLKHYTVDQFREMFTKAENSAFLKGSNNRNWMANFDWLVKDANFAKVLDGNYDNTIGTVATGNQTSKTTTSKTTTSKATQEFETNSFDIDELYNMALQKSYKELGLS